MAVSLAENHRGRGRVTSTLMEAHKVCSSVITGCQTDQNQQLSIRAPELVPQDQVAKGILHISILTGQKKLRVVQEEYMPKSCRIWQVEELKERYGARIKVYASALPTNCFPPF